MDRNWIWPQEVISDSSDRLKLRKFRTKEKPVVAPCSDPESDIFHFSKYTFFDSKYPHFRPDLGSKFNYIHIFYTFSVLKGYNFTGQICPFLAISFSTFVPLVFHFFKIFTFPKYPLFQKQSVKTISRRTPWWPVSTGGFWKRGYYEKWNCFEKWIFWNNNDYKWRFSPAKLYSLTLLSISYSWYDNVRWSDRRLIISEQVFRHSDHQVQFRGDNESLEILKSVPISVSNQFHGAWANSKSKDQFHGFQYHDIQV